MTFLVIPAIDLKGGRCVRLRQGRMEEETVYSSDPVAVAKRWEEAGASWIHAVDLDGALEGRSVNEEAVREILKGVGCKVQLGGGIRDLEAIERWLSVGVKRVVLGTVACERPEVVREAVLEFLLKALAGQEPSGRLYALAAKTLEVLETCPVPSLPAVFRAFEIKAMSFLGHRPELYSCVECGADLPGKGPVGFSPRLGGALCPRCRSALPDAAEVRPAVLRVLRRLLTTTLRALEDNPPSETVLNGAGRVLESFLEEQLPRYEGLRSLRMVRLLAQSRGA